MASNIEKLVDELSSLTIIEAAELSKLLEDKWGVTASSGMAAAQVTQAAAEEKTEFDLYLLDVGAEKIKVVKDIKEISGLGLKESKDLADGASAASPKVPDENLVMQLMNMGFSENGCKRAALATNNADVETSMNWILEHMEDPDFNDFI
jgi:large subunit ribosomal protein L7/L12